MHGVQHLYERICVDNPEASAFVIVVSHGYLGIFQVRVHARIFIEEPYPDQFGCFLGVSLIAAEVPCQGKGGDTSGSFSQAVTVVFVQLRVRFAVAGDIRKSVRLGGIGPEVACQAHVVVLVSAGGSFFFHHDGDRLYVQQFFRVRFQLLISRCIERRL